MSYIETEEFKDIIVVDRSRCDDSISIHAYNEESTDNFIAYLSKTEVKELIKMLEDVL